MAARRVATDNDAAKYILTRVEALKKDIISTMRGMGKTSEQLYDVRKSLNDEIERARSSDVKMRNLRKALSSRLDMLSKKSTAQRDEKAPRRNLRDL